jgi:proton-translocating NADH-quinone oxidoreductase chain N
VTLFPLEHLLPGLILLGAALLILAMDLLVRKEAVYHWAAALALAAVAGNGLVTLALDPEPARVFSVLHFDAFTIYAWTLTSGTLALIVMMSISYVRRQTQEPALFYAGLLFFGLAAQLVAASINTIMLLLAIDFLSIVSYLLTGFLHYDQRSTEAAIKYLIYGAAVTALMAYGLSWLYGLTGTTDYLATSRALSGGIRSWTSALILPSRPLLPVLVFILAGLAFKIAAAPFHQWAPDAYEGAPVPVAAALSVVPKVAGLAAIVRITYMMLPTDMPLGVSWRWPLMTFLAVAAMLFGNLAGLWQRNIKRLMAYSSIAQIGYALLGVAIGSEAGLQALLLFLVTYTLAELGAFGVITVVSERTGLDQIADYRGLYRRSPALAVVLIFSLLSLGSVPVTAGFVGKLLIFSAVLEADRIWLMVIAGLNTVIAIAYYWKVIRAVFVQSDRGLAEVKPSWTASVVAGIASVGLLLLGIYPRFLLAWLKPVVQVFFP